MTLIELLLTALCAAVGLGALLAENCLEALLIWMLPFGYALFKYARKRRKEAYEEFQRRKKESDEFWEKERELREKSKQQYAFDRWGPLDPQKTYAAAQQQAAFNQYQQSRAAQQAAMQARQGWTDPRASYGSDLADNIVNLWAINSMLNQSSAAHASTASQGGPAIVDTPLQEPVKTDPVQFHSFVNSSSDSSSSSSYSSDTSSDSFGGSDTSSDSF